MVWEEMSFEEFQDGCHGEFRVNLPFGSGEEAKNRFFKMAAILDFRSERF